MLSYFARQLLMQTKYNVIISNFKTFIELEGWVHVHECDFIIQISLCSCTFWYKQFVKEYEKLPFGMIFCASYHIFTQFFLIS
jgi:hypothetical protein